MRKIIKATKPLRCGCGKEIKEGQLYQARMKHGLGNSFRCLGCMMFSNDRWFCSKHSQQYKSALKDFQGLKKPFAMTM